MTKFKHTEKVQRHMSECSCHPRPKSTAWTEKQEVENFDLRSWFIDMQVTYSADVGKVLHTTPLALTLVFITALWQNKKGPQNFALTRQILWRQLVVNFKSFLFAIIFPAIAGFLRALISGKFQEDFSQCVPQMYIIDWNSNYKLSVTLVVSELASACVYLFWS